MTISKEHNNITFTTYYIDETDDNEYRNDSLNRIMYIYRVLLVIKSSLKKIMLKKLYKLRENIFCIINIENTV